MSTNRIQRLEIYSRQLTINLQEPTPAKHKNREKAYREYLESEIKKTNKKIEELKLFTPVKK
jgi:regulatory protein YycI of two-component signal transduction system YycFG